MHGRLLSSFKDLLKKKKTKPFLVIEMVSKEKDISGTEDRVNLFFLFLVNIVSGLW